jgi:hypothetical protein
MMGIMEAGDTDIVSVSDLASSHSLITEGAIVTRTIRLMV